MLELITLALGTLISEDVACITAGLLIASGRHSFVAATLACIIGIYSGDLIYYGIGRFIGTRMFSRTGHRWEAQIRKGMKWFEHHGTATVLTARFLPGARVPAYMAAGALGMSFVRFSTFFLIAAFIWTPILIGSSVFLGVSLRSYGLKIQIAAAIFLFIVLNLIAMLRDKRSRRKMGVRWRLLKRRFRRRSESPAVAKQAIE